LGICSGDRCDRVHYTQSREFVEACTNQVFEARREVVLNFSLYRRPSYRRAVEDSLESFRCESFPTVKKYHDVSKLPHRFPTSVPPPLLYLVGRLRIGVFERTREKGIGRRSVGSCRCRGRGDLRPLPLHLYVRIPVVNTPAARKDAIPTTGLPEASAGNHNDSFHPVVGP